jgi:hypothetical protein
MSKNMKETPNKSPRLSSEKKGEDLTSGYFASERPETVVYLRHLLLHVVDNLLLEVETYGHNCHGEIAFAEHCKKVDQKEYASAVSVDNEN